MVRADNTVVVHEENRTVTVATPGLQGPPGPQGPAGTAGGSAVIHLQTDPSPSWVVTHAFGREPNVVVVIDDEYVIADVQYPDMTTVVVNFGAPQIGKAVLS